MLVHLLPLLPAAEPFFPSRIFLLHFEPYKLTKSPMKRRLNWKARWLSKFKCNTKIHAIFSRSRLSLRSLHSIGKTENKRRDDTRRCSECLSLKATPCFLDHFASHKHTQRREENICFISHWVKKFCVKFSAFCSISCFALGLSCPWSPSKSFT